MDEILNIKKNIISACKWMEKEELVFGTWGNISVKYNNTIILTPSRISYDVMTAEDLVTLNFKGDVIDGHRLPSSEKELHRLIHVHREDVKAVVHNHSCFATAVSCIGRSIPAIDEEISQVIGGEISCTSAYIPAGRHTALAEEAVRHLGDKNAVLLKNHGVVCCGRDLEEALIACLITEKAAKIYLQLYKDKALNIIPEVLVKEERDRFLYKYGREN